MEAISTGLGILSQRDFFFKSLCASRDQQPDRLTDMRSVFLDRWLGIALAWLVAAAAWAQDSAGVVEVQVISAASEVAPGSDFPIAIVLDVKSDWHIWTEQRVFPAEVATFDGAVFTSVKVAAAWSTVRAASASNSKWITEQSAEPFQAVFAQWPAFHLVKADVGDGPRTYPVLEGRAVIFVPMSIATDAKPGPQTIQFQVAFQACDATTCLAPSTVDLAVTVLIKPAAPMESPSPVFADFDPQLFAHIHSGAAVSQSIHFDAFDFEFSIDPRGGGFFLVLLIAAIGGFLLNFTPCVLPVIPLKIIGLSRSAGNRRRCLMLGSALSIGVVAFWIALGLAVALVSGFTSSSQLFQYPIFTVTVGVIIAIMAVGMCGFFSIPLPQSVAGIDFRHDTIGGSVGFGVMTAVLSTPCTAPLMGAAAAWAATQTPWIVLIVFGAIGFGMALPYFILSAYPQLVSRVPKSGPPSDLVKQTMGLLLLAAAAYFIGAGFAGFFVSPPDPPTNDYWWVVAALGVSAGLWMVWRTIQLTRRVKLRAIFCGIGLVIALLSAEVGFRLTDDGPIDWISYTPETLADAQNDGDAVLIDFTAEWCLNCKALKKTVLESDAIVKRLEAGDIRAIRVDLTGNNPVGRALLKHYDRVTIPLLVVIAPDGREVFKSDTYTRSQVLTAIEAATNTRGQKP